MIRAARMTASDTRSVLAGPYSESTYLTVRNREASLAIALGDDAVTTANGFTLDAGESVALTLAADETLYFVASSAGATDAVHLLSGSHR